MTNSTFPCWALVPYGDAPPALAYVTAEKWPGNFIGDLMVVEMNQTKGVLQWRKRYVDYPISRLLHVFPGAPSPHHVTEARRALRRQENV
jgi:hypothetical protein